MRCELVASLLHRPEILFLDEPTIGLDVVAKATIRDLVRERGGATAAPCCSPRTTPATWSASASACS